MPNTLTNATLSNKRNRQRSVEPEVSNYLQFIDTLYDDLEFVIGNLNKYKDKYYQGMKDNSKQGENLVNTTICNIPYICRIFLTSPLINSALDKFYQFTYH